MNKGDLGYIQAVIDQKQYNLTFAQQVFVMLPKHEAVVIGKLDERMRPDFF